MEAKKSPPSLGYATLGAIGHAMGITGLRSATVRADHDDVTEWTVTFIPSADQVQAFGQYMSERRDPREEKPQMPPNERFTMGMHGGDIRKQRL